MATEREIEAEAYISGMERGVPDPTPKPTAEEEFGYTTKLTPRQEQLMARRVEVATSKAFEEAAEYAQFWWDVGPAKDRCTWRALEDLKVGLRALAKEKTK